MKVNINLEMNLTDENGRELPESRRDQIVTDTIDAIQNRLFGQGFLPDDVYVNTWRAEAVEEGR